MEPTQKRFILDLARKLCLKLFLVAVLLSGSVVVYADAGYFMGYLSNGDTAWLWCTSSGNFYTKCATGSCPTGQSCPCEECNTSACTDSANDQCAMRGGGD
jgi:hypothetical protein